MLLIAAETPGNCPVCTCPNSDQPQKNEPPNFDAQSSEQHSVIYAKRSSEDFESVQQPSSGIHMGPNELFDSAEMFSTRIFQVSKKKIFSINFKLS